MVADLKSLKEFYKDKNVFLTGHTGFKGAWLMLLLRELGANVKGYSLDPEERSLYNYIKGDDHCISAMADIRHLPVLRKEVESFNPDIIFHLAAQALVRVSYGDPVYTFDTNVMGTINVLDCIRTMNSACTAVIVTTDKVYSNLETHIAYKETDRLGGHDPYSASKACTELAIDSYIRSYLTSDKDKKVVSARAGNVIGGGDWSKDRIIPDLIRSIELNETLKIRNPDSIRPWQHVLEPIMGYVILAYKLNSTGAGLSTAYNFGPATEDVLTVKQLADQAIRVFGKGKYEIAQSQTNPHEAGLLKLDISRAKAELNWEPRLNSEQSIQLTMEWYKNYQQDAIGVTMDQIRGYLNGFFRN